MSSSRNRSGFRGSTQILAPLRLSLCLSRANITFTNNGKEQQMMKVLIELMASSEVSDNNNNISNTNGADTSFEQLSSTVSSLYLSLHGSPAQAGSPLVCSVCLVLARFSCCWRRCCCCLSQPHSNINDQASRSGVRPARCDSYRIASDRFGLDWIG